MTALATLVLVTAVIGAGCGALRWLRVAQREHYLSGAPLRFAARWWGRDATNAVGLCVALAVAVAASFFVGFGFVTAAVVIVGPLGLGVRGRTAKLAWTRRMRTVAGLLIAELVAAVSLAAANGGLHAAAVTAVALCVSLPVLVEIALALDSPLEALLARRYVRRASERLRRVDPVVVAITGSYGKTSTKRYVEHLLSGTRSVLVSPRSFNNRAGLARTVNESLAVGTDVFVAEMGTYGRGEIAALVRWLPPRVAAITAIGPVHLERFGSLDNTLAAKSEILAPAQQAVLNVDDPRLAKLAVELSAAGKQVTSCSATDPERDVAVIVSGDAAELFVSGERVGAFTTDPRRPLAPTNVACAVAIALALGVDKEAVAARLASLPAVEHRLTVQTSDSGVVVLDDTFNSNPAGTRLALAVLMANSPAGSRRVVVTPGMIELGKMQRAENFEFGRASAESGAELVVVASTNRAALLAGYRSAGGEQPQWLTVRTRQEAVDWVRQQLRGGDAVLYENDLPDHFP